MNYKEFLKELEKISGQFVTPAEGKKLHKEAKQVIDTLNQSVRDLQKENSDFEHEVEQLESAQMFTIEGTDYDNLRGKMVIEKLFQNLNYIPISGLESLVEKQAAL